MIFSHFFIKLNIGIAKEENIFQMARKYNVYKAFEIDGLEHRMHKLNEKVRTKFESFRTHYATFFSG